MVHPVVSVLFIITYLVFIAHFSVHKTYLETTAYLYTEESFRNQGTPYTTLRESNNLETV